jgi:hypothetical protein
LRSHATSLVLVAAALGLGVYVWVDQDRPTTAETEARKANLLPVVRRDDIREIVIEQGDEKATIQRRDTGDAGDFMYHLIEGGSKPEEAAFADQIAVERLIQALEFAAPLRKLEDDFDVKSVGLAPPRVGLTVHMGSITYRIGVGDEAKTPAGSRYATLEGHGVFVIPGTSAADLMRPIDAYRTRRILPYLSSELAAIELESGQGSLRIDRGPWGGFRVDSAAGKPRVSQPVFDRMLRAFADASAERFLEASVADRAVDQAKRKVRMVLIPKAGPRAELVLGGACPTTGDTANAEDAPAKMVVIVRKAPTPLHACVPSSVLEDLEVTPASLVDRRALRSSADEVEELQVVRGNATLELARRESGWHARKPEDRDIPSEDVAGYLAALLAVEGVVQAEVDEAKLGLSPPRATLTLRQPSLDTIEVPPQVLEIGGEVPTDEGLALAVRRKEDGVVLLVPASTAPLFEPSTTRIRSTELLKVNAQRMQRVEVERADGPRQILQRKGPGFSMEEPKGHLVDASLAADLFDAVSRLRTERWVADRDDGSFGLATPAVSVRLAFEGEKGEEKRTLILGGETPEGRYARWEPDTGVFVLSRALETTLRTYAIDRLVFMVDPSEVRSLTARAGDRDVRVGVTGDSWRSQGGSLHPMPEAQIARLRQALSELRAEGVVHLGAARPEEGFSKPLLRVEVESSLRKGKTVFVIGHGDVWRTMSVYYARREGIDATFAVAQSKVRPLLDAVGAP